MLGTKSGFRRSAQERDPKVKDIHCLIHRQALASRTGPAALAQTSDQTVKMVNFVKGGALSSRLFRQLCIDTAADRHLLLVHTNARWLSRGNVTARAYELRDELKLFFLKFGVRWKFFAGLDDEERIMRLAYFVDAFKQLNKLNLQMRGRNTNIIQLDN